MLMGDYTMIISSEKSLTKKQNEVLDYIKKYTAKHGYPPAIREIGAGLGLSSPATVHTHVKKLEEAGVIKTSSNKFRTIEILVENEYSDNEEDVIKVPLLGKVTAGNPIEAIERPNEFFDLPATLIPSKETVFTLEVSGESMINVGIYDGDYVIVQKQSTARNGDIVVAMTEENDSMAPFIFPNVTILGKAIGLYRKF